MGGGSGSDIVNVAISLIFKASDSDDVHRGEVGPRCLGE